MQTNQKRKDAARGTGGETNETINRRGRQRVVKAVTGALIGGIIAGPVGVAAGTIVGATREPGPVRKERNPKPAKSAKTRKGRARRKRASGARRKLIIYPSIP